MKVNLLNYELILNPKWIMLRHHNVAYPREHIWYRDPAQRERIEGYLRLQQSHPELFTPAEALPIYADRLAMLKFEARTGRHIGLVHNNAPYQYILSDLIDGKKQFAYIRVVPVSPEGGTVTLPRWTDTDGNEFIGVLEIYRHALRTTVTELPRGHLEHGLTPEENAEKELKEEFGVRRDNISSIQEIGRCHPDSGLTSALVRFFLVDLKGPRPEAVSGHEGIRSGRWLTRQELTAMLRNGQITDGMTANAFLHFLLYS